jgi:hypothetical protein
MLTLLDRLSPAAIEKLDSWKSSDIAIIELKDNRDAATELSRRYFHYNIQVYNSSNVQTNYFHVYFNKDNHNSRNLYGQVRKQVIDNGIDCFLYREANGDFVKVQNENVRAIKYDFSNKKVLLREYRFSIKERVDNTW